MDNPFKKIINSEMLPEIIKDKVMDDINFVKLALDVADLFAVKYPETIDELFKLSKKQQKIN